MEILQWNKSVSKIVSFQFSHFVLQVSNSTDVNLHQYYFKFTHARVQAQTHTHTHMYNEINKGGPMLKDNFNGKEICLTLLN